MRAGLMTELGELIDCFKKWYAYGKEFDRINAKEEVGDSFWYIGNLANILGYKLDDLLVAQKEDIKLDLDFAFRLSMNAMDQLSQLFNYHNPEEYQLKYMIYSLVRISDLLNFKVEELLENNIEKLRVRYSDKFTAHEALNRDLKSELVVLSK